MSRHTILKGRIQDVEHKKRFLARLRHEIRKLCVVRTFIDIEELMNVVIELKRVLGELGKIPYESLKEEQKDGALETIM
jgi:hypothetical protein